MQPENLDSTLPVYPTLASCTDDLDPLTSDLVDPLFKSNLLKEFTQRSIHSVGDLAQLTERDVNRLPIKSPKVSCLKRVLSKYEERRVVKTTPPRPTRASVSSSTPLGHKRLDRGRQDGNSFEDLMRGTSGDLGPIAGCKATVKRMSTDSGMQTSPAKKVRRTEREACRETTREFGEEVLLEELVERFGLERISERVLKKYKVSAAGCFGFFYGWWSCKVRMMRSGFVEHWLVLSYGVWRLCASAVRN